MKTNELKKGTRVCLKNGWKATLLDNKKGNIREAEVYGYATERGSIYAHDIKFALINGEWVDVVLTPAQKELAATIRKIL